jgi:hypothetical protein
MDPVTIVLDILIIALLGWSLYRSKKINDRLDQQEFYLHTHPYKVTTPMKTGHDPYAGRGADVPNP